MVRDEKQSGTTNRSDRRGEIRVVDLSQIPSSRGEPSPLERRILETLQQAAAGVLGKDELMARLKGYSFSDVERALRDLSLRGLVKVLWRTPFRFMAFLNQEAKASGSPQLAPARALTA